MNKNTLAIYFTALTALYSTQAIGFEWKYDLEVKVALPTSVTIGVATFPIPIDPAAERPGKITGKIKWECATSAIIVSQDGCYCTPENPAQDGLPRVVQTVNAEPYVLGQFLADYLNQAGTIVPSGVTLPTVSFDPPPSVEIDPTMEIIGPSDKCFDTKVRVKLKYTPGKITAPAIPLPNGGELGPWVFTVGTEQSSTFLGVYRMCCCTWTEEFENLPVYVSPDRFEPFGTRTIFPDGGDECMCPDNKIRPTQRDATGDSTITWKIKAVERNCDKEAGTDPQTGGGASSPTMVKCVNMANEETPEYEVIAE